MDESNSDSKVSSLRTQRMELLIKMEKTSGEDLRGGEFQEFGLDRIN